MKWLFSKNKISFPLHYIDLNKNRFAKFSYLKSTRMYACSCKFGKKSSFEKLQGAVVL